MKNKKWTTLLIALLVVAVLVPINMSKNKNENKQNNTMQKSSQTPSEMLSTNAAVEKEHKLKILQNDITSTEKLFEEEIKKDMKQLASSNVTSSRAASDKLKELQNQHPYMVYIKWQKGKEKVQIGNMPETEQTSISHFFREADNIKVDGEHYISPPYSAFDQKNYSLVSAIENGVKVTAVVERTLLAMVEEHQQKNLRLIPYPPEGGKYKVQAVEANTIQDKKVVTGEDNGNTSHYYDQEVVVHFKQRVNENQLQQMKKEIDASSLKMVGETYIFKSKSMDTVRLMQYFKERWSTDFVEPHYLYITNETYVDDTTTENVQTVVPNDALYSRYQWNIPIIDTEKGWNITRGDENVIIAVLDTGVQLNHPDLQGKLIAGTNITNQQAEPTDEVGHGTHVAGIIGAAVNNGEGVAGVSWYNKIMPVKVLDASGSGSTYDVAQGIIWATDNGAKVINMSLGNYASAQFLHEAIKYAYERDVVLIAASGNDNTDRPGYPAAYPEVFAVGATNSQSERAVFSNYGDYIDVAAPGDSIASTYIGGQYAALSGTSMASPHVAALAGLIRSVNPNLTNVEVMEIMRQTAIDLGDSGKDPYFGYGSIDVDRALQAASTYGGTLQTYPQNVKNKLKKLK